MTPTKEILLTLLRELEEQKAILSVVAQRVPNARSLADNLEAKNQALQANAASFDKLRKQIEALP